MTARHAAVDDVDAHKQPPEVLLAQQSFHRHQRGGKRPSKPLSRLAWTWQPTDSAATSIAFVRYPSLQTAMLVQCDV